MMEEIKSLNQNQTWELVDNPKNHRVVDCKWIYKRNEVIPRIEQLDSRQGWLLEDLLRRD